MIVSEMFCSLRFNIQLLDKTGSVVATVFQRDAEGMFGITTEYMRENTQQVAHNRMFFFIIKKLLLSIISKLWI